MITIAICLAIALLSILFLIGWFFYSVNEYQKEIDKRNEE